MTARLTVHGQETWHRDVVAARSDGRYLTLELVDYNLAAMQPSRVHYWLGDVHRTSVLLCATDEDVMAALREERQ
jgi:hypothetical protein